MLTRSAFPVSLLYRNLEKFNDAFNFLLTSRLACVPIDHYCFSGVQQSIVNLLLYHSFTKMRVCCFQFDCIEFCMRGHEGKQTLATIPGDRSNYPIPKACSASNRIYSSDDLRGVDGQENSCPPVAYISDLIRVSSHAFQLAEQ